MTTDEQQFYIAQTIDFVKTSLAKAESGHDWWHIYRVHATATEMAKKMNANKFVVEMAALLHDIADSKFNNGDERVGPKIIRNFLFTNNLNKTITEEILFIIENMSFKSSFKFDGSKSLEFQIVQDADRLDAIGAIGIARAFSYGGFKGHIFYDPDIKPQQFSDSEQYKNAVTPTINHFYEKLLLLKDKMNTEEGKRLAELRHQYMLNFLKQFDDEWAGRK